MNEQVRSPVRPQARRPRTPVLSEICDAARGAQSTARQALPLLAAWGARALYLGPAFGLSAHRNAAAVLALGLHEPIEVARDARHPARGFTRCRSVLIEPNTLHLLRTGPADLAFIYLDAARSDLATVRAHCRERTHSAAFDHAGAAQAIALLRAMPRTLAGWHPVQARLAATLGLDDHAPDPRIAASVARLLAQPAARGGVTAHAQASGWSLSHFQHRFKAGTGVSFRRMRLWTRLQAAVLCVAQGDDLTTAAHATGFASSAHLSSAFRAMFGMAPSALGRRFVVCVQPPRATGRD
jgi:AraC-like DNA-binding protein